MYQTKLCNNGKSVKSEVLYTKGKYVWKRGRIKLKLKRLTAMLMLGTFLCTNSAIGVFADEDEPVQGDIISTQDGGTQDATGTGTGTDGTSTTTGTGTGTDGSSITTGTGTGTDGGSATSETTGAGTGTDGSSTTQGTIGTGEETGTSTGDTQVTGDGANTTSTTTGTGTGTETDGAGATQTTGTTQTTQTTPEHTHCLELVKGDHIHYYQCTDSECDYKEGSVSCTPGNPVLDGYYVKTYCTICEQELSSVDARPTIVSVEDNNDNPVYICGIPHYTTGTQFTVKATIDQSQSMEVVLAAYDVVNETSVEFQPDDVPETDDDGNKVYTFTVDEDGTYYYIMGALARNSTYKSVSATMAHECYVQLTDADYAGVVYTVSAVDADGNEVWKMNDSNENEIYYSSTKYLQDKLKIEFAGVTDYEITNAKLVDENDAVIEGKWKSAPNQDNRRCCIVDALCKAIYDLFHTDNAYKIFYDQFENSGIYYVPAADDGEHTYTLSFVINGELGQKTVKTFIDNAPPEIISTTYNGSDTPAGSSGADTGFYNEDVRVEIKVKESNLINEDTLEGVYIENEAGGEPIYFKAESVYGDVHTFAATVSGDGSYQLKGTVADKANNIKSLDSQSTFTIDKTKPVVQLTFDNNEATNDKYFNKARTATITVKDTNFPGDDAYTTLTLNSQIGTPQVGGWEKTSDDTYSKKIEFSADGIYSLTFNCKDKAGNSSEQQSASEFVVDLTAPEVKVSFDNNTPANENYFKESRMATITIEDISFSSSLVSIDKASEDGLNALPAVTDFNESDGKYVATMKFNTDGKFGFNITCKDLAGNSSDTYTSGVFFIDTTLPEIEITGVTDMSANNGTVEPVITVKDLNLKSEDIEVHLTGSNNGEVAIENKATQTQDGYTLQISDLAHEKANDDLYTLTAKVKDLAGNEFEKQISYSINRFGSIYVVSPDTKKMIDDYYVTTPQNVVITEINVDTLTYKEVSVTHDGDVNQLSAGRGYTTSELSNENGWHSISYTVGKSNFESDGIYSVTVYSEDKATNKQSNQSKEAEIEFLMDQTSPSVVVSGIESDGIYEESQHDFSVNATDTVGVAKITVYADNKVVAEYEASELTENGGTEIITLAGKDDYQQIALTCQDVSGNETTLTYDNVLISEKAQELIASGTIEKQKITRKDLNNSGLSGMAKGVMAVVGTSTVGAAGAVTFGFRRFKK